MDKLFRNDAIEGAVLMNPEFFSTQNSACDRITYTCTKRAHGVHEADSLLSCLVHVQLRRAAAAVDGQTLNRQLNPLESHTPFCETDYQRWN